MDFLSKENENLLKECIERDYDFPTVLVEKLEGLSALEDRKLRCCIKALSEGGYISKLQWGDNIPYYGCIEQKGYDYFYKKEVYIRAKLRQDPHFTLLDDDSEETLRKLCQSSDMHILFSGGANQGRILEHLSRNGCINFGTNGLTYDLSGEFVAIVSVTQKGKSYFADKDKRIEEIMILGENAFVVNNIDKQINVSENTILNSPFQIGDGNTQNIDYHGIEKKIAELKSSIDLIKLSDEQKNALSTIIESAENECKSKNSSRLKAALEELWDFAKQTGSTLLAAYLELQFGLGA